MTRCDRMWVQSRAWIFNKLPATSPEWVSAAAFFGLPEDVAPLLTYRAQVRSQGGGGHMGERSQVRGSQGASIWDHGEEPQGDTTGKVVGWVVGRLVRREIEGKLKPIVDGYLERDVIVTDGDRLRLERDVIVTDGLRNRNPPCRWASTSCT
eukprot:3940623-Pyramimonas_sp.AAC.1